MLFRSELDALVKQGHLHWIDSAFHEALNHSSPYFASGNWYSNDPSVLVLGGTGWAPAGLAKLVDLTDHALILYGHCRRDPCPHRKP